MKADSRQKLGWGNRLRLLGRMLGLTGLFASGVGALVLGPRLPDWKITTLETASQGGLGQTIQTGSYLLLIGLAVAAFVLVIEGLASLFGSGRRSAAGFNSGAQTILAVGILLAVNFLALQYPKRWDLTRDHQFTLPESVTTELRNLRGRTTIVVLQQHKTFGQLSAKPDIYDYAAERKVVEKVRDLVDQFREIGPQFKVISLDVEAIGFDKLLDQETDSRPGLREAIAAAPENSIFFYADDRVETLSAADAAARLADGRKLKTRPAGNGADKVFAFEGNIPRMSFNEFFQLDKSASRKADAGSDGAARGNLVLRPQGVESFARRVISIQEKKPKVALMTIHEWLTTGLSDGGQEQFSAFGLRKSLEDHGFEVIDVLLKRWPPREEPTPAAYNVEETEFDRLATELESLDDDLRTYREEEESATAFLRLFKELSLEELNKRFRPRLRREVDEEFRTKQIQAVKDALRRMGERVAEIEKNRRETEARVQALMRKDRAFEDRRVTDVRAKMTRLVSDCDLLIIPRHTVINNANRQLIDSTIYKLSKDQVGVVRDFLASGKPVLACLGPNNEPQAPLSLEPLDDFERLLGDVGIELGRQTVLFDSEAKGLVSRQAGNLLGSAPTDIPPVSFPPTAEGKKPNPIARAMQAIADSADQSLELRIRHPRPIYLSPEVAKKFPVTPEFLQTSAAAWNEEQPFPNMRQVGPREVVMSPPRFEATPFDDPKKGTRDEERRGPFPIGLALETAIPLDWYDNGDTLGGQRAIAAAVMPLDLGLSAALLTVESTLQKDRRSLGLIPRMDRKTVRLAVIGNGGVFTGRQLSPAHEQLLLHSCNWLLQRDDRLPKTESSWSYPRTELSESNRFYWQWGPLLGLPLFFLYVGVMVLMIRRVR